MPENNKELTFGEKAAGVTFNPGRNPEVDEVKKLSAALIDKINTLRSNTPNQGMKRYYSKAISNIEDGQMNAVKAITWEHD